jgi:type IV pilus assembly protein PilM
MNLDLSFDLASLKRMAERLNAEGLARFGLFRPMYPPLALELGATRMNLVYVDRERKQPPVVRRHRSIAVPEGSVSFAAGRGQVLRPADLAGAIRRALDEESIEEREISVVLPDHLGRVSLLHIGERPAGRKETLEMIRWKVKKTVPFNVDDAHIDYQIFPTPGSEDSYSCLTTLVLQKVLGQFESLFADLGLHVGLLDLSTFTLTNLYLPLLGDEPGDVLILNVTGSFFALLILRDGAPLFYRAKSYRFAEDSTRQARLDLVTREMGGSLAFYRERLSARENPRVLLRCIDLGADALAAAFQERLGMETAPVDPSKILKVEPRGGTDEERADELQRIGPALGAALGRET